MSNLPFADRKDLRFRATGVEFPCLSGQETTFDFLLDNNYFCNGAEVLFNTTTPGSRITFQIVDKDNIMGMGENTILDTFVNNWYLSSSHDRNGPIALNYPALLRSGLYIRLIVFNRFNFDITCYTNLFLHLYTGAL